MLRLLNCFIFISNNIEQNENMHNKKQLILLLELAVYISLQMIVRIFPDSISDDSLHDEYEALRTLSRHL